MNSYVLNSHAFFASKQALRVFPLVSCSSDKTHQLYEPSWLDGATNLNVNVCKLCILQLVRSIWFHILKCILPNFSSVYIASHSHMYFEPDFRAIWFYEGHTAGFCALCAIQNHVRSALQSTGKILSPLHLVKNLRCILQLLRLLILYFSLKWKMACI